MTRTERRQRRYITVRNRTHDVQLARKARDWSDETIQRRLGIRIPLETPTKKPMATGKRLRRLQTEAQRRIAKYQYAVSRGATQERARKLKGASWKRLERETRVKDPEPGVVIKDIVDKKSREDEWSGWAKDEAYPQWLKDKAHKINKEEGFDHNAAYGWAVMFYAYVNDEPVEMWQEQLEPDPFDGNRYVEVAKGAA